MDSTFLHMNKAISVWMAIFSLLLQVKAQHPLPKVVKGRLERMEHFQSQYVTARNIDIWLPEGYADSAKYSVLYMHDGQMLFDPEHSWNKQAWDVDDVAAELGSAHDIKKFIVVGIWNGEQTRHTDYFPQKPFERLSQMEKDTVIKQLQSAGRTKDRFEPQSDSSFGYGKNIRTSY